MALALTLTLPLAVFAKLMAVSIEETYESFAAAREFVFPLALVMNALHIYVRPLACDRQCLLEYYLYDLLDSP